MLKNTFIIAHAFSRNQVYKFSLRKTGADTKVAILKMLLIWNNFFRKAKNKKNDVFYQACATIYQTMTSHLNFNGWFGKYISVK